MDVDAVTGPTTELPSAAAVLREFAFEGDEALAVDPWGRRWLADVEGSGRFAIDAACPVDVRVDGEPSDRREGSFREVLTVVTAHPGRCRVRTLTGMGTPPAPEEGVRVPDGTWRGRGWLLSAESLRSVDGRPAPLPAPRFPVPVFVEAVGQGMRVGGAGPACVRIDSFRIDDVAARKARGLKVQNLSDVGWLEAPDEFGELRVGPVASHLNTMSWLVEVPAGAVGLRLRKRYDRFHGRQRARVLVDGRPVGWWYEPVQDRRRRWAAADFGFPIESGREARSVRLAVDPPAGVPLWSVGEIEVWAVSEG
ncbi:MAG: hypothetical protein SNJ74_01980 [Fimbriimonadaceae bacterium]